MTAPARKVGIRDVADRLQGAGEEVRAGDGRAPEAHATYPPALVVRASTAGPDHTENKEKA